MAANTLQKKVRRSQSISKTLVRRRPERPRLKTELELRVRQFLEREIDFIPNRNFRSEKAPAAILGQPLPAERMTPASRLPRDLPAHLARLCEAELLTAEMEATLFRRMNYLKFRANVLRAQLNPDRPHRQKLEAAQAMLAEATEIRGRIIRANMRLVISIIKKFVGPQNSFDDMLSEGTMSLMHAVDKFDFSRGFRFSTYAYRAIARNAYRSIMDRHRDSSRFAAGADDALFDVVDERQSSWISEHTWNRLRKQMASMLDKLDRREQFIIRGRFALGAHRKVRTFQSLADRLGISKERVRQLEQRAVEKLRQMATTSPTE